MKKGSCQRPQGPFFKLLAAVEGAVVIVSAARPMPILTA
jgi:hypothetical protein